MLQIFDTGISSADENMSFDAKLLETLDPYSDPILHLYDWEKPSATFGYFIRPEEHLNLKNGGQIDLAKRPTGGGIIFHIWDLAFSFLMPIEHPHFSLSTLKNYEFVNRVVLEVVKSYFSLKPSLILEEVPSIGEACRHFCMAKPTQYDVVFEGVKIAGAAQRRSRLGYLHQGTISLCSPDEHLLKELLLSQEEVIRAMNTYTFAPIKKKLLQKTRAELQKLLAVKLKEALKS